MNSENRELNQKGIPVYGSLFASVPSYSLDSDQPFGVIISHKCTTSRPIWALANQYTYRGSSIEIYDPSHSNEWRRGRISRKQRMCVLE